MTYVEFFILVGASDEEPWGARDHGVPCEYVHLFRSVHDAERYRDKHLAGHRTEIRQATVLTGESLVLHDAIEAQVAAANGAQTVSIHLEKKPQ